jgi:hypothetical protein
MKQTAVADINMSPCLKKILTSVIPLLAALVLTACGGGGSGGTDIASQSDTTTPPPAPATSFTAPLKAPAEPAPEMPAIATESSPNGATIDLKAFTSVLAVTALDEARWEYDITDADGKHLYIGGRHVYKPYTDLSGPKATRIEYEGDQFETTRLVARDDGIYVDHGADASLPPKAAQQIGLLREYAYDTYAIDEPRTVVRQGTWDMDLDGDSQHEQFRLEYTQVFRGFETLTVPLVTARVARFSNKYRFSITSSKSGEADGYVVSEEAYLARGAGPLKFVRHDEDLAGNVINEPKIWTINRMENVSVAPEPD